MTKQTVLIADDDPQLANLLAFHIKNLGLEARTTFDALSALNEVSESAPDLIILDVNMPAGNGLSVCEMLATDPCTSLIPVIILTGRRDNETIRRCHDLLAYYVLKSPSMWPQIEGIIRNLLQIEPPAEGTEAARAKHFVPS